MSSNDSDNDCQSIIHFLYSADRPPPLLDNFTSDDGSDYNGYRGYERFGYVIDRVINPTACIIGFVGNLLNVILMVRSACRRSPTTGDSTSVLGLTALSSVDISCCCVLFMASLVPHSVIFSSKERSIMFFSMYKAYAVNAATRSSSWMTVLLALMRYAVICRPLQTRHLISVKALGIAIASVVVSSYLAELPALWTYSITEIDCSEASHGLQESIPAVNVSEAIAASSPGHDYNPGIDPDDDLSTYFLGRVLRQHPNVDLETLGEAQNGYINKGRAVTATVINGGYNKDDDDDDEDDGSFDYVPISSRYVRAGIAYSTTGIISTPIGNARVAPSAIPSFYLLFSGPFLTNTFLKTGSIIAWFIFGFFGPMCILVFCNYHLVLALRRSRHMAKLYRHDAASRCSAENRLTFTFVCIISVYVLFVCPSELVTFVLHFVDVNHQRTAAPIITVTNSLQTFNYTFNFIMYSFPNFIFRQNCCSSFFRGQASSREVETPFTKVPHSAVSHVQRLVMSRVVIVNDQSGDATKTGDNNRDVCCVAGVRRWHKSVGQSRADQPAELNGLKVVERMKIKPDRPRS